MFRDKYWTEWCIMFVWAMFVGYCTFLATQKVLILNNFLAPMYFFLPFVIPILVIPFVLGLTTPLDHWKKRTNSILKNAIVPFELSGIMFILALISEVVDKNIGEAHLVLYGVITMASVFMFFGTALGLLILNFYEKFSSSYDKFFDFRTKVKP